MTTSMHISGRRGLIVACVVAALFLSFVANLARPADAAAARLNKLLDLRPGEWRALPGTNMSAVYPPRDKTTWGTLGPDAVIMAWGGAAYDTKRNAFVFHGGGHTDYGGNEVYAFLLEELRWVRLTEPSPMRALPTGQYVTTDNTPVSTHTYDGFEYLPNVDRIFRNGGAEWLSGNHHDRSAWLFDMDHRRWERKSNSGGSGHPVSGFDPVRGTIYVVSETNVEEYDPVRDIWIRRASDEAHFLQNYGAIDPVNRRLITDSYRPGVVVHEIRPDGSLSPRVLAPTKGATGWDKASALEYDPVRKVLVGWTGGREIGYLDGKTLVWRHLANAESPAAPVRSRERDYTASGAIYGRWRYVPKYDVFIGYNNPRGNLWVWKPAAVTAGDATPPPPPAPPPPAVIKPLLERLQTGQTIVLPPGAYKEAAVISANNVVIKAHGVRLENTAIEGKAALVIRGSNVTIEGLECAGIAVPDGNGACVRLEARDLALKQVQFRDSQSGILSWNRDSGTVLIEDSRFERLGNVSEAAGQQHGVYIGRGNTHLIIRKSSFLSSRGEGHEIKSRAAKNTIEHSVIASLDGVDSRLIDLPEGGENIIRHNILQKGRQSTNQDLIGVGLEGAQFLHAANSTLIEQNTIIMERPGGNVLVHHRLVPTPGVERNIVIGGKPLGGSNTWFPDRAAAGLGKYPGLPKAR